MKIGNSSFTSEKEAFFILALHLGFTQGAVQSTAPHSQNTRASGILRTFLIHKRIKQF